MIRIVQVSLALAISLLSLQCSNQEPPTEKESSPRAIQVNAAPAALPTYQCITAQPTDQSMEIRLTGRVQALEKLQLVAEVPGKALASKKLLNEGVSYRKGETMVRIEDQQYRYNLQAQKSQFQTALVRIMSQIKLDYPDAHPAWDSYLRNFEADASLAALPEVNNEQLRYFLSANGVYANFYNIKSTEELGPKYKISAPFTGVVVSGSVAPGTVIGAGKPLATYSRTDVFELKTTISTADLKYLKVGQNIPFVHTNTDERWTGTIHRFGGTIDPTSQAVPVFVRLSGKNLRKGLFLEGELGGNSLERVVELPVHALNRANQVHVISDQVVSLQDVQPVQYQDKSVWVHGLEKGQLVIVEPISDPIVGTKAQAQR